MKKIMIIIGAVFILPRTLLPIGWSVPSSITPENELSSLFIRLVPHKIIFDNYKNLLFQTKYKGVLT